MNRDTDEAIKETKRNIACKDYYIKRNEENIKKSVTWTAKNTVKYAHGNI
jgi:hypothetical protein